MEITDRSNYYNGHARFCRHGFIWLADTDAHRSTDFRTPAFFRVGLKRTVFPESHDHHSNISEVK